MSKIFWALLICQVAFVWADEFENFFLGKKPIITSTKKIELEGYPNSFNPSLFKTEHGFVLSFRYIPDRYGRYWLNYIGVVLLNEAFEPISEPDLLFTRSANSKTPSQAEDARIFSYRDRLFVIYNDNLDVTDPWREDRRDMFMAELLYVDDHFKMSAPLKLIYEKKYNLQTWQKNWAPFEWNKTLLMSYSLNPHEVIHPNLYNGSCYFCYETQTPLQWNHGTLRGSSPPLLVDGEYLAFFHSSVVMASQASWNMNAWHYFMGAYTFSADPPFELTKMSPEPIAAEGFYTQSNHEKRVIFPGGFVVSEDTIYMAYGKDDHELWIATIDKKALKESLVSVKEP